MRELRESARYNPARDRFKVWIIDEVHMLSMGAFNALLKTLEEPPPRVKFVFATTEYHKIPDTILSRCQQYDFRLIPAAELQAHLRRVAEGEGVKVSDEALARIARAAEGSARDALSLLDQVLSFSAEEVKDEDIQALLGLIDRELLLAASRAVAEGDSGGLLDLVERLSDYGADPRNFARELLLHFREILLLKIAPEGGSLLSQIVPEERERLRPLAAAYSEEDLLRIFEVLTKAETDLRLAQDPRVTLELALLKMVQMRRLAPFAELVAKVERLASGVTEAPAAPAPSSAPAVSRPPAAAQDAPARRAAPAPAPATPATATATDPASILAAMATLAQARPSLAQPLRTAQGREEGDTLVIEVAPDFAALAAMHVEEYRELARSASGRPWKVRIGAAAATAEPPAPSAAEAARRRLTDDAVRAPAVQEALDLFNGKVLEVRATKPAKEGP